MAGRRGNNEGTITKRKDGRWEAKVCIGKKADGSYKRIAYYGNTRSEVSEKLKKALADLQAGKFTEPNRVTVSAWLDKWMEVYQKPKVGHSTYDQRERLIRLHIKPVLGNHLLQKLRPADLQALYAQKLANGRIVSEKQKKDETRGIENPGLSSQSVRHIHNILYGALKQAVKEGLVFYNVAADTTPPRIVKIKEIRPLNKDEISRFLATAKMHRLYAAFFLELSTGLRRGELLGLQWSEIDLDEGILKVRQQLSVVNRDGKRTLDLMPLKTASSYRTISLPQATLKGLKEHKTRQSQEKLKCGENYLNQGLVFCTAFGGNLDPRRFTRTYQGLLKKAGIEQTRFHDLRHSFATIMLEAGENIKVIQDTLGHADIETTLNTYSHVLDGMKRQAADKLDQIFIEIGLAIPDIPMKQTVV